MLSLVVDHFARDYDGGGGCVTWSGVRASPLFRAFFFCSILVRGDISGVPRSIHRNRVAISTDHYGSAYPCTAGSGGICIVGLVPARAAGGRGYATCTVPFLALSLVLS